ncbi:DegV family protein [Candidatus Saccharibacteria bacterium]|nr:DegV family protein [Candidatus Saccharibacteria bacterium]
MRKDLNFIIVTDSCAFSLEEFEEIKKNPDTHIWPELLPQHIYYEGEDITGVSTQELSEKIEAKEYLPGSLSTASGSIMVATDIIRRALEFSDARVLVVSTSFFISQSTANGLQVAVEEVIFCNVEYAGRLDYIDSRSTSHGQSLFLRLLDEYDGDDPVAFCEKELIPHIFHRFTEPDLTFALRSGRYSGVAKVFSEALAKFLSSSKRLPYMYLPSDDKLKIHFGRLYTQKKMLEVWRQDYIETHDDNRVIIEFAGTYGKEMAEKLREILEAEGAIVSIYWLPPIILAHTGPVIAWHNKARLVR